MLKEDLIKDICSRYNINDTAPNILKKLTKAKIIAIGNYLNDGMCKDIIYRPKILTKLLDILKELNPQEFPILDYKCSYKNVAFNDISRLYTIALMYDYLDSPVILELFKDCVPDDTVMSNAIELFHRKLDYKLAYRYDFKNVCYFSNAYILSNDVEIAETLANSSSRITENFPNFVSFCSTYEDLKPKLLSLIKSKSYGSVEEVTCLIENYKVFKLTKREIINQMYDDTFPYTMASLTLYKLTRKLIEDNGVLHPLFKYFLSIGVRQEVIDTLLNLKLENSNLKLACLLIEGTVGLDTDITPYLYHLNYLNYGNIMFISGGANLTDYVGLNLSQDEFDKICIELFKEIKPKYPSKTSVASNLHTLDLEDLYR